MPDRIRVVSAPEQESVMEYTPTPEFRAWLSRIAAAATRRELRQLRWRRRRDYLRRLWTCWVATDPNPQPSNLDILDGINEEQGR